MAFTYYLPTRLIFAQPAADALRAELASLPGGPATRVLLVTDPGLVEIGAAGRFVESLAEEGRRVTVFSDVSSNPTTVEVAAGLDQAQAAGVQALVALGGGSAIDVAKAIAMLLANGGSYADYQWGGKAITQRSVPLLVVPTTAGTGSEVSRVAVIVDPSNPLKKGVLSPLMFPYGAVYDAELTRTLPPQLTAATGMDALIHALEAYTGRRSHPYTDSLCLSALTTAAKALPRVVADGSDMEAREAMLMAALWGGTSMDHAGLGLVHSISGPLTGHLHLHHGLANALILPYALRFNLPAIPAEKLAQLNHIFGLETDAPGEALVEQVAEFVRELGLPGRLGELGRSLDGVDWAAIAAETTRMVLINNNPRPVTAGDVELLLQEMR